MALFATDENPHAEVGSCLIDELAAERDEILLGLLELRTRPAGSPCAAQIRGARWLTPRDGNHAATSSMRHSTCDQRGHGIRSSCVVQSSLRDFRRSRSLDDHAAARRQ
jgi:hypothetical protein